MKKSKKIIFVCCFCVLISLMLFVVPCSAVETSDYREYVFNDTVSLGDITYEFDFYVKSNEMVLFNVFELRETVLVWYDSNSENRLDPYNIDEGWLLQEYRVIMIDYSSLDAFELQYFNENGSFVKVEEPNGIYNDFYSIFVEYVYGDVTLTPEMRLSAVLCSSIMAVLVIAFPIIIVFWVSKFILNLMR